MDFLKGDKIRGNIETIILRSIMESDKYGYEIIKDVEGKSNHKVVLKQPTLYSCLKRLEKQSLIEPYWGNESHGGRRRYYKLTTLGKNVCEKNIDEWEASKNIISNLVDDFAFPVDNSGKELDEIDIDDVLANIDGAVDSLIDESKNVKKSNAYLLSNSLKKDLSGKDKKQAFHSARFGMKLRENTNENIDEKARIYSMPSKKDNAKKDESINTSNNKSINTTINNKESEVEKSTLSSYTNNITKADTKTDINVESSKKEDTLDNNVAVDSSYETVHIEKELLAAETESFNAETSSEEIKTTDNEIANNTENKQKAHMTLDEVFALYDSNKKNKKIEPEQIEETLYIDDPEQNIALQSLDEENEDILKIDINAPSPIALYNTPDDYSVTLKKGELPIENTTPTPTTTVSELEKTMLFNDTQETYKEKEYKRIFEKLMIKTVKIPDEYIGNLSSGNSSKDTTTYNLLPKNMQGFAPQAKMTDDSQKKASDFNVKKHTTEFKIENSNSIVYKNKLLLFALLLVFAITLIEEVVFFFVSNMFMNMHYVYLILISLIALLPLGVGVFKYAANPHLKVKSHFSFKKMFINAIVSFIFCLLAIFAINLISGTRFNVVYELLPKLVLPTLLILNYPISVIIYNALLKSKKFNV